MEDVVLFARCQSIALQVGNLGRLDTFFHAVQVAKKRDVCSLCSHVFDISGNKMKQTMPLCLRWFFHDSLDWKFFVLSWSLGGPVVTMLIQECTCFWLLTHQWLSQRWLIHTDQTSTLHILSVTSRNNFVCYTFLMLLFFWVPLTLEIQTPSLRPFRTFGLKVSTSKGWSLPDRQT